MTLLPCPHGHVGCNVTTCPNGKCQQTGECQDKPRTPEGYCTETGSAWCYAATITAAGQCDTCPEPRPAPRPEGFEVSLQQWAQKNLPKNLANSTPLPLPSDSAARKNVPMASGLLDYFPDALAEIAHVSYLGNEKHNPGEPLHHARGKSMDHADCIVRHLTERGSRDPAGVRHSAQMAWRALALLQEELERDLGLPLPRGARG